MNDRAPAVLFLLALALLGAGRRAALAQGFSGYAEVRGQAFSDRAVETDPWVLGWATLLLREQRPLAGGYLDASVRLEDLSSADQGPVRFDLADREPRRPPLALREFWWRTRLGGLADLQLGRFDLGWGKTDGYSPADAFLPRDLTERLRDERLPVWGARLTGQRGALRFEGVFVPVTTPWRLPILGSRYLPVSEDLPAEWIRPLDGDTRPPRKGFGVVRVQATHGDWDLGVWVRDGIRPAPVLVPRIDLARLTPDGHVEVPVDRRWDRERGVGVELAWVAGAWVLRAEGAALFAEDEEVGRALLGSVGCERGIGDGTLILTLAGNGRPPPGDERLLFDRGTLPVFIAAWTVDEDWGGWRAVWMTNTKHRDGLLKAEIADSLTDVWKLTLGADYTYGTRGGPFGALYAARQVYVGLRRSW